MKSEDENGVDPGSSSTEVAAKPPIYSDLCNRVAQMARRGLHFTFGDCTVVTSGFALDLLVTIDTRSGRSGWINVQAGCTNKRQPMQFHDFARSA